MISFTSPKTWLKSFSRIKGKESLLFYQNKQKKKKKLKKKKKREGKGLPESVTDFLRGQKRAKPEADLAL